MTPAEQPIPDRLYDTMFDFILKWFTIMALSDGVGLNSEQFTIRMSTWQPAHPCELSHPFVSQTISRNVKQRDAHLSNGGLALQEQQLSVGVSWTTSGHVKRGNAHHSSGLLALQEQ